MGWLIALGIVVVLAIIPLGASVIYDQNGPLVRIIAGPLKIQVFPMKKKAKQDKPKKEKKQAKEKPSNKEKKAKDNQEKKKKQPKDPDEKGGSILDFWPFVELALNFLGDFRRKLRVGHLKLHMTMAADDPADLAINYGRANAAMAAMKIFFMDFSVNRP